MAYQDMIVCASDEKAYAKRLEREKLKEYNVKINLRKCEIEARDIDGFGLLVDFEGVHPHPNRLKPRKLTPSPTDLPGLRSW